MVTRKRLRLFVSPSKDRWVVQWDHGTPPSISTGGLGEGVESSHPTRAEALAAARALVARLPPDTDSQIVVRPLPPRA